MDVNEIYSYIIDHGIVSEEALNIITNINGYNEETLNEVLYCVSGYHDMEQYLQYEDRETYAEYYENEEDEDSESNED